MKLRSIAGRARGRDIDVEFTAPVTVLSAPTGAGKSTLIQAAIWALTGGLPVGSKRVRATQDVFALLSHGGEDVSATVTLDDGFVVRRSICQQEDGRLRQELRASQTPRGSLTETQAAINARIGDLAVLDVGAFLTLGPTDRRRRLLDMVQQHAPVMSEQQVVAQVRRLSSPEGQDLVKFSLQDGEDLFEALRRHVEEAKQAVRDNDRAVRETQAAVNELTAQAAEREVVAEPEELAQQIEQVNESIRKVERSLGEARSLAARWADLERQELAQRQALDNAQAAQAELAQLVEPSPHQPNPTLASLQDEIEMLKAAVSEIAGRRERLNGQLGELRRNQRALQTADCCPVCRQTINEAARSALDSAAETLSSEVGELSRQVSSLADEIEMLKAERARLEQEDHDRQASVGYARQQYERRKAQLGQTARPVLPALDGLRQELEQLGRPADISETEMRLAELVEQQRQLTAAHKAAIEGVQIDREYKTAVARREEVVARKPILVELAKAWEQVLNEFGQAAVQPLVETAEQLLPFGWRLGVDLPSMQLFIERLDGPSVLVEALSQGEQALFYASMAAALASLTGGLRLVVADHSESLTNQEGDWSKDGLLVELTAGLASAVEKGVIDQAIVATSRLEEDERTAIESSADVQTVPTNRLTTHRLSAMWRSVRECFGEDIGSMTSFFAGVGVPYPPDPQDFRYHGAEYSLEEVEKIERELSGRAAA